MFSEGAVQTRNRLLVIILYIQNARISTRYGNSAGQFNSIIPLQVETISILETYQTNKIAVTSNPATHTAYDS